MLRVLASLSLVLGTAGLAFYLHGIGKGPFAGPAERHLRRMKDRVTAPDSVVALTFADFAALPHGRPLAEYARLEARGVSLEGYASYQLRSMDGDLYLPLSETPVRLHRSATAVTTEITQHWTRGSERWQLEPMRAALRSPWWTAPPWPDGPRRTRVSGWLLYDFQYDAPWVAGKGKPGPRRAGQRLTGWEIHPVTRIEIWDDTLRAFRDYPR